MQLSATLFDMDGLLIDSEILWQKAELEILGGLGVPIAQHATRATKGMFVAEVVRYWHAVSPWSSPSQSDVVDHILQRVGDLVESEGRLLDGALRAIDLMSERGRVALASSTPTALIERSLDHFSLRHRFELVASAADEQYGKPHPAVFLTAAARLGVEATSCLVFEDSGAGVLAAKAARMSCVAVPVIEERNQPVFAIADLVLDSLSDLSTEWLDERFAEPT
jgi:HAD superfamily hydrolase (TIGR01509 family)